MEDIVTARMDYTKLDRESERVRIRLNSTVVRVKRASVDVTYVRDGRAESVRGRRVVLACWHAVIPYLCPELGEEQLDALAYGPKVDDADSLAATRRTTPERPALTEGLRESRFRAPA